MKKYKLLQDWNTPTFRFDKGTIFEDCNGTIKIDGMLTSWSSNLLANTKWFEEVPEEVTIDTICRDMAIMYGNSTSPHNITNYLKEKIGKLLESRQYSEEQVQNFGWYFHSAPGRMNMVQIFKAWKDGVSIEALKTKP